MSTDRLMGSFVVRVLVRDGIRSILLHDFATAATRRFPDFASLAEHLEGATRGSAGAPGEQESGVPQSGVPESGARESDEDGARGRPLQRGCT